MKIQSKQKIRQKHVENKTGQQDKTHDVTRLSAEQGFGTDTDKVSQKRKPILLRLSYISLTSVPSLALKTKSIKHMKVEKYHYVNLDYVR